MVKEQEVQSLGKFSRKMNDIVKAIVINTWQGLWEAVLTPYRHRTLLWVLVKRDLVNRTSGTVLGCFWPLIQPALQIIGFWFLFEVIFRIRFSSNASFLDYLLVGLLPWLCAAEILSRAVNMFIEFSPLFKRNPFPLVILPVLVLIIPAVVYTAVYFVVTFMLYDIAVALSSLLVIPLLLLWLLPFCYLLPVIGLFVKDFGQALPFMLTITMYLTPILYLPDMLPASVKDFLLLNPFADLMALIHYLIQDMPFKSENIIRPLLLWLVLLGPAWLIFRRSTPHIREIL